MKVLLSFTLLIQMLAGPPSLAAGCHRPEVSIFFSNGMFNDRSDAQNSRKVLQTTLSKHGVIKMGESIYVAYNTSEPFLSQFFQVAAQKDEEFGRRFWQYLANLSLAPEFFRKISSDLAKEFDQQRYLIDEDLRKQIANYLSHLKDGKSVIIVAHSQGHFYANSSWYLLQSLGSFANKVSIIGAATPVSAIAGDGPYTSLTQDVFMNQVRRRLGALPANLSNSASTFFGHDFVNDYLHGDKSGPKIISDIRSRIVKDYADGVVELADSTYVHESLLPFWKYVNQIRINSEKNLTPPKCLAIASFAKTYDWWGEACEERSLDKLELWMTKCFENEWSRKDKFDFDRCSLLGDDLMGFVSVFTFDFMLAEHPECVWHESAVSQNITPAVLAEAKLLLRSPPH